MDVVDTKKKPLCGENGHFGDYPRLENHKYLQGRIGASQLLVVTCDFRAAASHELPVLTVS